MIWRLRFQRFLILSQIKYFTKTQKRRKYNNIKGCLCKEILPNVLEESFFILLFFHFLAGIRDTFVVYY